MFALTLVFLVLERWYHLWCTSPVFHSLPFEKKRCECCCFGQITSAPNRCATPYTLRHSAATRQWIALGTRIGTSEDRGQRKMRPKCRFVKMCPGWCPKIGWVHTLAKGELSFSWCLLRSVYADNDECGQCISCWRLRELLQENCQSVHYGRWLLSDFIGWLRRSGRRSRCDGRESQPTGPARLHPGIFTVLFLKFCVSKKNCWIWYMVDLGLIVAGEKIKKWGLKTKLDLENFVFFTKGHNFWGREVSSHAHPGWTVRVRRCWSWSCHGDWRDAGKHASGGWECSIRRNEVPEKTQEVWRSSKNPLQVISQHWGSYVLVSGGVKWCCYVLIFVWPGPVLKLWNCSFRCVWARILKRNCFNCSDVSDTSRDSSSEHRRLSREREERDSNASSADRDVPRYAGLSVSTAFEGSG